MPIRSASAILRLSVGMLLALLLALRLLSPAGFMPTFEHGAVTIVACPDGDGASVPMSHHHHPAQHDSSHQPCPYAAASGFGTLGPSLAAIVLAAIAAVALAPWYSASVKRRYGLRERPPSQGPPLPA